MNTNGSTATAPPRGWPNDRTSLSAPSSDIHRTLPHSIEAEMGVLGSMLISPRDAIGECVERSNENYFFQPRHQTIFSVLVELWGAGQAIDFITFTQVLRDRDLLETVGGAVYITELFTFVPTAANVVYYLEILRDKYILRQIIASCTENVRRAFEEQDEVNALLDDCQARMTELAMGQVRQDSMRDLGDAIDTFLEQLDAAHANRGKAVTEGLSTGFVDLDRVLNGLKEQQLITIGGMTSQGKTAVATNIAEHVAFSLGLPVGIWSMEMSYQEEGNRICAAMADVPLQRARDGFLSAKDIEEIPKKLAALRQKKHLLHIDDERGLTITQFAARARRMVKLRGFKLIVVDHLQFLSSSSKRAQDNRAREISEITYGLKGLAKELRIPVILLSHVSREADKRASVFRRPKLSDLKESSSIEQDSDVVIFVWRPGRFVETDEDKMRLAKNLRLETDDGKKLYGRELSPMEVSERDRQINEYAELVVAKQRNGAVTSDDHRLRLRFESDITKFQSVTKKAWSNRADERQGGTPGGHARKSQAPNPNNQREEEEPREEML